MEAATGGSLLLPSCIFRKRTISVITTQHNICGVAVQSSIDTKQVINKEVQNMCLNKLCLTACNHVLVHCREFLEALRQLYQMINTASSQQDVDRIKHEIK